MENSILTSTKKILGIPSDYAAFDLDILTHINSTFSILNQMGLGPTEGFDIIDDSSVWADFDVPAQQLNMIRTYIFLKVRLLFDPPTTGYLVSAAQEQIKEYEVRLYLLRDAEVPYPEPEEVTVDD